VQPLARGDQAALLACDAARIRLAGGDLAGAAVALGALHAQAAAGGPAFREAMLVSAELSVAAGDRKGAQLLARAAQADDDDRAAALLASLALDDPGAQPALLRDLATRVTGRRSDTLAIRARLAARLGMAFALPLPAASQHRLAAAGP
jgi:hypothetical protein